MRQARGNQHHVDQRRMVGRDDEGAILAQFIQGAQVEVDKTGYFQDEKIKAEAGHDGELAQWCGNFSRQEGGDNSGDQAPEKTDQSEQEQPTV